MTAVASPCVRFCTFDPATGICVGCGRTLREILDRRRYSDKERLALLEELSRRVRALRPRADSGFAAGSGGEGVRYAGSPDEPWTFRSG
jgi:predicted Fe-S protein YdhL (DUF1289 family)